MKELKFRAWNTARNCWTSRVELDGGWGKPMFLHGEIENDSGYQTDNTIIEQYTGLKDKNGKEIYEGDIVKLTGKVAKNKSTIYKVVWDSFLTGYDLISLERGKADVGYLNEVQMEERYDVIGNIHDNPELLEEEE